MRRAPPGSQDLLPRCRATPLGPGEQEAPRSTFVHVFAIAPPRSAWFRGRPRALRARAACGPALSSALPCGGRHAPLPSPAVRAHARRGGWRPEVGGPARSVRSPAHHSPAVSRRVPSILSAQTAANTGMCSGDASCIHSGREDIHSVRLCHRGRGGARVGGCSTRHHIFQGTCHRLFLSITVRERHRHTRTPRSSRP